MRAIRRPPQFAVDRVVVFVDEYARTVGAARRPEHCAFHVEHAELQESTAEAHARRKFVSDPVDHGDPRVERATIGALVADGHDRGLVHRLIEHRVLGGRD